jgi:hypothetical protein
MISLVHREPIIKAVRETGQRGRFFFVIDCTLEKALDEIY